MSGYRLIDFYFVDTDELLKDAWISDLCTVSDFVDCARGLGYLRHDRRLSEVAVVHRAQRLVNEFLLSSADVAPGEHILVLRSLPDVDSKSVYGIVKEGLNIRHAMAMLRYTSNNLDEAKRFVGRVWHPRAVRDMLLDERSSLCKIVNVIGCDSRWFAEHFVGSLLLNPACFERELTSISFDSCAKDQWDGGPLFYTFAQLLRIYHRLMPNATLDCRFCKGRMFSEHEEKLAESHHMNARGILKSLELVKLEQVRWAAREFRIAVDAGFCPSLVLYAWCLEIFCDVSDDYEIRRCLNAVDDAACGLSDKYVQRLYRKLRKRHGKERSRGRVFDLARGTKAEQQNACIFKSWGRKLQESMRAKFKVKRPVVIQDYLRSAAIGGDSWAQQAVQSIQYLGYIPNNLVKQHLRESWNRIFTYLKTCENGQHGTCHCIPNESVDSKRKAESQATLDLNVWRKESLNNDPLAMYVYGLCLCYGYGSKINVVRGMRYVQSSAESGCAEGQCFLAMCLSKGKGVEQDLEESARYYKMGADQGNAPAQFNYALCLSKGKGVPQNLEESARYYKMSADQGYTLAQNNYAACLSKGKGVPQNLEESAWYYKMSAYQGFALGQYNYAVCLSKGKGVLQNND